MRYLALLRAINVGGGNLIKMVDLKACFERAGFKNVVTYIASGNVIFEAPGTLPVVIEKIETLLSERFSYKAKVVLITLSQLEQVVTEAPKSFGAEPEIYRYDVIFLKPPLTASEAIKQVAPRKGVDTAISGTNVLYFSRLIEKASQSHLSKIILLPMYKNMTIRTWGTVTKLLALMQ